MIGCRSQLVIGVEPMSNACSKCARNLPHDIELCPKMWITHPRQWRRSGLQEYVKICLEITMPTSRSTLPMTML
jgi:predicted amidophosphoribosyltransferase